MKIPGNYLGLFSFCLIFLFASSALGKVEVLGIRHWTAPDHTRIVLDLNQPVYYDMFELRKPNRLVIDLKDSHTLLKKKEFVINDRVVSKVRWGYFKPATLRVVVDLIKPAQSNIFTLKKFQDKPDRLVIDVFRSDLEEKERKKRTAYKKKTAGTHVVVIDPGHGGEDPGAVGPSGIKEKTVALEIAKKLRDSINREPGFRAFLTREKDYFIPLRKRWKIAREYKADAFISIHANASFNKKKRGTEVYCLSRRGASQEAARILAAKENFSDQIGGVDLDPYPAEVDSILVRLEQIRTINDGLILGKIALQELRKANTINFPVPLQAGFAVLKAPDIPSILVEVGYISNPKEEKLLSSNNFQSKIAAGLKRSIVQFFQKIRSETASLNKRRLKSM